MGSTPFNLLASGLSVSILWAWGRLAQSRTIDKIGALALYAIVIFGILDSPSRYFQPPDDAYSIAVWTVGFITVWLVYAKGATREMIPPRRFWIRVPLFIAFNVAGVSLVYFAATLFGELATIIGNSALSLAVLAPYPFANALSVLVLLGVLGLMLGGAFIMITSAIGDITGEWRIVVRLRRRKAKQKVVTKEEREIAEEP